MKDTTRARRFLLIFGIWTAIALAYASHLYFYHALREGDSSWSSSLIESFADWYTWALLSIPVLALARRFPLNSTRNAAIHIALSLLFSAVQVAMHSFVDLYAIHGNPTLDALENTFRAFFARTFHFGLLVYWLIVIARESIVRYRDQQVAASELQARLAEAHLQTLRMQLHPHFLFNTLNTIASLMHQDVTAADRMIVRLSELLRMTLNSGGEQQIPLQKELELLNKYLEIEQARFAEKLSVRIDAPPDTRNAFVPSFFLQPIVENCVRHGIAPSTGAGSIEIEARRENGELQLRVTDNGKGMPESGVQEGIGLSNTRMRLQQLYGSHFELRLQPAPGHGTEVRIAIPYTEKPA